MKFRVKLKTGDSKPAVKSMILLLFKMEIITENNTINPPIKKIVLIALIIEADKTSPKFDIDTFEGKASVLCPKSAVRFLLLHFHHLKIKPTVIHART